jgi:hypothetical protein
LNRAIILVMRDGKNEFCLMDETSDGAGKLQNCNY